MVIVLHRLLPGEWKKRMLLLASYYFYGSWDWRYLALILIITLANYVAAARIHASASPGVRKGLLAGAVTVNLVILGVFKYYGFFTGELVELLNGVGLHIGAPVLKVALPVGISFYTFQSMSYTIDVYKKNSIPAESLVDFALFVSFFPQLVAGPIERYNRLMPQLAKIRPPRSDDFRIGLYHVVTGLFRKIVIADNMAPIVDSVFSPHNADLTGAEVLLGVYCFSFQIYCDFSGYSSIAQGISRWMGVDLMYNFRLPYFSKDPSEFWRRWHVSLSEWFRDYLYIPLGGNRGGRAATYRNLLVTMALCGLWHGAAWTFVFWGFYHGLLLAANRALEKMGVLRSDTRILSAAGIVKIIVMFHLAALGWLFFRAENFAQAVDMLGLLVFDFHMTDYSWYMMGMMIFFLAPFMAFETWLYRGGDMERPLKSSWIWLAVVYIYCANMMYFFHYGGNVEFIYFQF